MSRRGAPLAILALVLVGFSGVLVPTGGAVVVSDKEEAQHLARHIMGSTGRRHSLPDINQVREDFARLRSAHAVDQVERQPLREEDPSTLEDQDKAPASEYSLHRPTATATVRRKRASEHQPIGNGLPPKVAEQVADRLQAMGSSPHQEAKPLTAQTSPVLQDRPRQLRRGKYTATRAGGTVLSTPLTELLREADRQEILSAGAEHRTHQRRPKSTAPGSGSK
uniref:Uncharacterized protein n=1 Tax=Rhizochromulina marina TaxID=1034831 RepID=A0A7S2W0U0_9STRA|mmetsp:Transcript_1051/g.3417  ORF Transcript_1051/g.3417 Transcript_1051/m.3417 type:complete len:223 (+) Transcript_1051:57-725(+)